MRLHPGTTVGRYAVLDFIAAGGMGEVYRARDPRLGRDAGARRANLEAIRRAERQIESDPTDSRALSLGGLALDETGERDEAFRWSARAMEPHPDPRFQAFLARLR